MEKLARALSVIQQGMLRNNPGHVKDNVNDLTDQVFPALKSAFLDALPRSWFCYFPCFAQQRITLWAGKAPPCREAFSTQVRLLVDPPVHQVPGTPVPAARHWVVTCCDHFPAWRPHSVLQRPSRICPAKLIYEPGFLKMSPKLVFAELSCVPGGPPPSAAPSRIHWLTPLLDAKINALVVIQGYYLEDALFAYPWGRTGRGNREVDKISTKSPLEQWSFSDALLKVFT